MNLQVFSALGDSLGDISRLSSHCWPHWNKFLFYFTTVVSLSWILSVPSGQIWSVWNSCSQVLSDPWAPVTTLDDEGPLGAFSGSYVPYYCIDYEYQKGQKCFLNVKISTFSFVQKILSGTEKLSKVTQLMANPELKPQGSYLPVQHFLTSWNGLYILPYFPHYLFLLKSLMLIFPILMKLLYRKFPEFWIQMLAQPSS